MKNVLLFAAIVAAGIFLLPVNYWIFIGGLAFLIVAHEFGHWFVARLLGFEVSTFSIGFGKPALKFGRLWGTDFQVTPWLLGGYVSINPTDPTFQRSKVWKRAAVMAAGVTMNTLLAICIAFWMFAGIGEPRTQWDSVTVKEFSPTVTAARDAGVNVDDQFVAIDGKPVREPADVRKHIQSRQGSGPVTITVKRNGATLDVRVTPNQDGLVGIVPGGTYHTEHTPLSVKDAAARSLSMTADGAYRTVEWIAVKLKLAPKPPELPDEAMELHGIVAIAQVGANAVDQGMFQFLLILWMLNINLAVFNLLPLPVLDGGHLVFLGIEKLRGKPVSTELQGRLMTIFGYLLFGLMIYAVANDFINPILK